MTKNGETSFKEKQKDKKPYPWSRGHCLPDIVSGVGHKNGSILWEIDNIYRQSQEWHQKCLPKAKLMLCVLSYSGAEEQE